MNYQEARSQIKSGQIIFFKGRGIISRMICVLTGYQFSHVGIAAWVKGADICCSERRLMVIESEYTGGVRIVSLSAYENTEMEIVDGFTNWKRVFEDATLRTGVEKYGYRDLVRIWLREKFDINLGDTPGEVCSEFVAKLLRKYERIHIPEIPSPGKLKEAMKAVGRDTVIYVN